MGQRFINLQNFVKTTDGSNTLYSKKYNQHYHNIDDGAINESLNKHVIPCLDFHKNSKELNILDICFGIGYNTLSTVYYVLKENLDIKLNIYSPELDGELIESLKDFDYPKEFKEIEKLTNIIKELSTKKYYEDERFKISLYVGDARKYIKSFEKDFFNVVYQDAFSSEVNMELWTKEYFDDVYKASNENVVMTSYSVATPVRLSMYKAGFEIYEHRPVKRKITLAFKQKQEQIGKYIDMELKQQRNKEAKAIYDL